MSELRNHVTRKQNAVYARVTNVDQIQEALHDVNSYLSVNKLQPVTSPYLVKTNEDGMSCIEIYIDVCACAEA